MRDTTPELSGEETNVWRQDVDPVVLDSDVAAVALSPARLSAFVRAALRARRWGVRRVLSHGIDPGISFERLLSEVRSLDAQRIAASADARRSALVPPDVIGGWWRALARVVALQGFNPTDGTDGVLLHDVARLLAPVGTWSAPEALTYAQLLWRHDQRDRLRTDVDLLAALDPSDRLSLEVDLAADQHGTGSTAWNDAVARMLGPVSGVAVAADAETAFDGLRAVETAAPIDGPLVSVIMSAFRPGPEILTSVRSILEQSWTNLELVVVDDASGPEYAEILARVAALDPRVRVLVQPQNRGTYGARNRAIPETRGDFVTFQDSDDWSHPERIARQVHRLLDDPELPAVMSRSIRCTPALELQLLGYRTTRANASSLMLRRSTIDTLGFFDPVRKSADSEYELRVAAQFGRRVPVMPELLAFVRLDPSSLSRSDFKPGWWHPARHAYRDGYRHWHREIERGAAPWLSADERRREFPAPRVFLRGTSHVPDERPIDLLFVADWREVGGVQSALLQQIRVAVARGLVVGFLHLESLRALDCVSEGVCREIRELQSSGDILGVLPDDQTVVTRLVLGDPALLNYAPAPMTSIDAREVVIFASTPPFDAPSGCRRYDPAAVTETARAVWGGDPEWVPAGERVRAGLAGVGGLRMASVDISACVAEEGVAPRIAPRQRPIIGAAVGIAEEDGPVTADELLKLFPVDTRFDVRLIGSAPRLAELTGRVPGQWLLFRPDELTQRDLFRQIDFFVSPAGNRGEEQVVPRVIDAVTAGAIAIVPPSFKDALGDGAVYAAPDEVSEVIRRLFVDPGGRAATIARGRDALRERFSDTFADKPVPISTRVQRTD